MTPLLSILIPVTPDRLEICQYLVKKIGFNFGLHHFVNDTEWVQAWVSENEEVELIVYNDQKVITIGEKREKLYDYSLGLFSWQIDSDDDIADNAIELILNAIKSNPDVDVISFEEYVNMDGKEYRSNHAAIYSGWEGDGNSIFPDGFHFHRTPFFKSVIRTELAKSNKKKKIRFGEDHAFANDLHPLIKSEFHISEQLYRYIHRSSDHNTRYGIKD